MDNEEAIDEGSPLSDAALIEETRGGSRQAYHTLWERHMSAGLAYAGSHADVASADDLVAEAFTRILAAIRQGNGPSGAFRAYLVATIRNVAIRWGQSGRRETNLDDFDQLEGADSAESQVLSALERSITARAFSSLAQRWQEVLWYSEVEQLSRVDIAVLLGIKPNAVSQLMFRAREALRAAWIQVHLNADTLEGEHREVVELLGLRARGTLSRRDERWVQAHIGECPGCLMIAEKADEVGSRLAFVILPLFGGIAGATHYLAAARDATPSVVAASAGAVGDGTGSSLVFAQPASLSSSGAGSTSSSVGASAVTPITATAVASGWMVAAGISAAAAVIGVSIFGVTAMLDTTPPNVAEVAASQSMDAAGPAGPEAPAASPTPTAAPIEPPRDDAARDKRADSEPQLPVPDSVFTPTTPAPQSFLPPLGLWTVSVLAPLDLDVLPTSTFSVRANVQGAETVRVVVDGVDYANWTVTDGYVEGFVGPLADGTHTLELLAPAGAPSRHTNAGLNVTVDTIALPPAVTLDHDPTNRYLPTLSGTAEPGGTVAVSVAEKTTTVSVGHDGAWSAGVRVDRAGSYGAIVSQIDAVGNVSEGEHVAFVVDAPRLEARSDGAGGIHLRITAADSATVEILVDGISRGLITLTGPTEQFVWWPRGAPPLSEFAIRYADPTRPALRGVLVTINTAFVANQWTIDEETGLEP